jgi:hypothetical protein
VKRILFLLVLPLVFAPSGYYLGTLFADKPPLPSESIEITDVSSSKEILYDMPLGSMTVQVMQPDSIVHIVMSLDVYLAGASEFERLGDAQGKAMLRDATILAISDLAERSLWIKEGDETKISSEKLAVMIAKKLYKNFKAVRSARVKGLWVVRTSRR